MFDIIYIQFFFQICWKHLRLIFEFALVKIWRQSPQNGDGGGRGGVRACLYDPGQAGRDAYRGPARNTNSNECLYDAANYPA